MSLTKEQLKELEELARLQFSVQECSVIMSINQQELFISYSEGTEVFKAYQKGVLGATAEVRKVILEQAKNGSSPAQKEMLAIIKETVSKNSILKNIKIN